jgi:hypothetical protein
MSAGLRWEATGVTGRLFPALDADIRIADDGGKACEEAGDLDLPPIISTWRVFPGGDCGPHIIFRRGG